MPSVNLDEDGYINVDWYFKAACDVIERGAVEKGRDITKITANEMTALYRRVYVALFKPEKRRIHGEMCNIAYNTENISRLLSLYAAIAGEYNVLPSIEAFEVMSGIEETTLVDYVTSPRNFITKYRRTWVQNKLGQLPIGVVTLANNDIDTGLTYTRQNITDRATVSKALNFSDLVKIGENASRQQDVSRLETAQTQDIVDEE